MKSWQEGYLHRMHIRRMFLGKFSAGEFLAAGTFDLNQGQFKVTHQSKSEPPKVGEQLTLSQRRPPKLYQISITVTDIRRDPENEGQIIYSFQPEGEWRQL